MKKIIITLLLFFIVSVIVPEADAETTKKEKIKINVTTQKTCIKFKKISISTKNNNLKRIKVSINL